MSQTLPLNTQDVLYIAIVIIITLLVVMSAITSNRKIRDYAIMSQHGLHSANVSRGGQEALKTQRYVFVLLVIALPELCIWRRTFMKDQK